MAEVYKREWHYEVFESCSEFETWQTQGAGYERNIQSIVPLTDCGCDTPKVMVTWWIHPPGSTGGHGCPAVPGVSSAAPPSSTSFT